MTSIFVIINLTDRNKVSKRKVVEYYILKWFSNKISNDSTSTKDSSGFR